MTLNALESVPTSSPNSKSPPECELEFINRMRMELNYLFDNPADDYLSDIERFQSSESEHSSEDADVPTPLYMSSPQINISEILSEDSDSAFSEEEQSSSLELQQSVLRASTPSESEASEGFEEPLHRQVTKIAYGILSDLSPRKDNSTHTVNWKKFCSDDQCIYRVNQYCCEQLLEGNFFEENGKIIEIVENGNGDEIKERKWLRNGDWRRNRREIGGKGTTEDNRNGIIGVIGDRDTKIKLKRAIDEEIIKTKSEALARMTWDPARKCIAHKEPLYIFCEICNRVICSKCVVEGHQTHRLVPKPSKESVFTTCKKLQTEIGNFIREIENSMKHIKVILQHIDGNAAEAANNAVCLLNSWEYVGSCIHRREYLLTLIKTMSSFKKSELTEQYNNLANLMCRLSTNASELRKSFLSNNANIIFVVNISAREDIDLARQYDYGLLPVHTDEFRLEMSTKFDRTTNQNRSAALTVIAPTVVAVIKKMALTKIPFLPPNRYTHMIELKIGKCVFGSKEMVQFSNTEKGLPQVFGGEGSENGKLCRPWGICCDAQGRFFVSDRSNNRVQVFDSNGTFMFTFGKLGAGPDEFNRPAGIVIDSSNRVVIADKDNHRVQVFTVTGKHIFHFGHLGDKPGQFHYPWDVASNTVGQIAVSDTKNRRIQLFTKNGIINGVVEFYPYDLKLFDLPRGVKYNKDGELIVGDFNNHRFIIFDQNFSSFKMFGSDREFNRPQGLCIDDEGNFVIADSKNNRVVVYSRETRFVREFTIKGAKPGTPQGICVTPDGRIAVVDLDNHCVHVI